MAIYKQIERGGGFVILWFSLFSESPEYHEQVDCIPQEVYQGRFGMGSAQWLYISHKAVHSQARKH